MSEPGALSAPTYRAVRAPRGTALSCKGWQQEGALRMLMNSLDPEVAERPEELFVSGAAGKPARDWDSFQAIVASLRTLEDYETLLVEPGKPARTIRTHAGAPRVIIAGASWSYVGTRGVLPTTYEIFAAAAAKHFGGTLAGRLVVCGGMGGAGGAAPLAASSLGAAFLGIDADAERIKRRLKTGYCDTLVNNLDEALRILKNAVRKRVASAVGLIGNCADVIPLLARRGVVPDLVTDQTPTDEPSGYLPQGLTLEQAAELRLRDAAEYQRRALDSIAVHVRGLLELQKLGAVTFEYGNDLRAVARAHGVPEAETIADGVAEYLQPLFSQGRSPVLWVALSGEPADVARADDEAMKLFAQDDVVNNEIAVARRVPRFQGLPARLCWLDPARQATFGLTINDLIARGEIKGPVALSSGDFATGFTEAGNFAREEMPDTADDISDWLRVGRLKAVGSACWVSVQRNSNAAEPRIGWGAVADGSSAMTQRLQILLGP